MSDTVIASSVERRVTGYLDELERIFRSTKSKHEAHDRSRAVLEDMSGDREFISSVLFRYLSLPESLNAKNYPVVGINVNLNRHFHLVANCWIPLPTRESDISSKAIHHHGNMLLTTVTLFGPGYEHWLFSRPRPVDPERELYEMDVVERARHHQHHVAFVDAWIPHLPVYPERLSITLCLWSSQHATTWLDYLKRIPWLSRNAVALRQLAVCAGLAKSLDLKVVNYFDFYPAEDGFKGMKERIEYSRGPNEDHLQSVFHVIQETGNERLAPVIERHLEAGRAPVHNLTVIRRLLDDLRSGRPIEGRLSACHLNVPHAMFRTREIERVVARRAAPETAQTPPA